MGGPDPGPLTSRSGQRGLPGPAGHPCRGPSDGAHDPWWAHCLGPTGARFRASEPGTSGEDLRGLRDPAPRASWHRGRETVCGWLLVVWSGPSTHAQPELSPAARSQLPQPGATVGGLRTRACWVPVEAYSPSPDRGRGFFGSGDKQPKAARQTDPALTDQSPVWTLPLPPGVSSSSSAPGAGTVQLVLHAGLAQDRKPLGLGGARVLPGLSPPYPGLGVLPLGGCLPPSWSTGETRRLKPGPPHTRSPHQPACPGCPFFSTIKPPRSGGLQNPGGETKVGVSRPARPAGHLVAQPAGHLVARPGDQMARDDPGSAAGRQASRPLTAAGVRSLWDAPPRGSLPPRPLLRPGGFPAPAIWSPRRPARDRVTPPVPAPGSAGREAPMPCGTCGWPSAAPRGGDRPRRWAPEAVSAGSRGTPQRATRGTQPGAPGRGGPASPARPPAEAGWRRLGAPAGVPPRQDPGEGDRDPAAGDRGWSDLGVGATKGAELPCDGPSRAPGKAPGRLTDERPSDRRSPGRNPGPQGAFEVSMINVSCNSH
ncbi:hypothetical protein NDU88_006588 [Pleurodeles waltl]|uniref:Uncharacterized protein n=1 Tax=Pleurodeles waltl TaxID=8319 RepID=A0AAV7QLN9_PLEWA|nr:hypothetical protein NDU88_006588 [Pleurodeles waltl]